MVRGALAAERRSAPFWLGRSTRRCYLGGVEAMSARYPSRYSGLVSAGTLIRERRQANGLSQAKLARRAGSTQAALSRLERDEVSPTFDTVARLLAVMGEEPD